MLMAEVCMTEHCSECSTTFPSIESFDAHPCAQAELAEDYGQCPVCGGPSYELGTLGNREHFRCQNCGMDFSRIKEARDGC
jgi:DNA-directed RNA polymerase subunit RPC12/RpoP